MVRLLHYSDIENVYDDPTRVGRFAGLISSLSNANSLVVGTGDNTAPGVTSLVSDGRQALDLYRQIGTDVATFGNHDFDYGLAATIDLVADAPQTWVNANIRDSDGDRFGADVGVVPTTTRTVNGSTVGFFGVTDPATPSINPTAADLVFDDPIDAAARAVAELRSKDVDYIVALSHLGAGDDALAEAIDIDVILGGHVHRERIDQINGTVLTRPGVNGHAVLEVTLSGDDVTVKRHDVAGAPVIESVKRSLQHRLESAGVDTVVGHVETPIVRDPETVHGGECRIGNFVADAYRWAADADVGLQNSGGIRSGPPLNGDVTVADFISVIPFEEPIVTAAVTGEELWELFEQLAASTVDFGEDEWWHGHISNATVTWDAAGETLLDAAVNGEPVAEDRTYTVATAEYLLHSDHEFPAIDTHHHVSDHGVQHEVLAEYARQFGITPTVSDRIRFTEP